MTTSHEYLGLAGLSTRLAMLTNDPLEKAELLGYAFGSRILARRRLTKLEAASRAARLDAYGVRLASTYPQMGVIFRAAATVLADAEL